MEVKDHSRQLRRIADEIGEIASNSKLAGMISILSLVLLCLAGIGLIFAVVHWVHGGIEGAATTLAVEVAILILHAISVFIERRLHSNHESRIDRLRDELYEKADELLGVVHTLGLKLRRAFRRSGQDSRGASPDLLHIVD